MEPVLVGAPVPFVVAQILEPLGVLVEQADRHDLDARTFGTPASPNTTLIVWFALAQASRFGTFVDVIPVVSRPQAKSRRRSQRGVGARLDTVRGSVLVNVRMSRSDRYDDVDALVVTFAAQRRHRRSACCSGFTITSTSILE